MKEERDYVGEPVISVKRVQLVEVILLRENPRRFVKQFWDERGVMEIEIDLPKENYSEKPV